MMRGVESFFPPISFVLLQAFLVPLLASEVTNKMFSDCSPNMHLCGSKPVNISYPFRVPSMPDYCGHPSFELKCLKNSSIWELSVSRVKYRTAYIDYDNRVLNVMDQNFQGSSCPKMFANTTFDLSLFNYTENDLNLTLYFNCSPSFALPSNLRNISCLANDGYQSYYRLPYDDGPQPPAELVGSCSSVVLIPMYIFNAAHLVNDRLDFLGVLQYGFDLMWMVGKGWCSDCKDTGGVCGYDHSAPNAPTCFCPNGNNTIGTCLLEGSKVNENKEKIIIGLTVGLVGFILACLLFIHFVVGRTTFCNLIFFWKNLKNDESIEAFLKKYGSLAPKRYTYRDVKKITKNFHDILGKGGFGTVFKGTLRDDRMVAVKVLSESKGNGEEFVNEVASIGKTSHINIVSLLGFCSEGSKRALIYDFVCNGSLADLIYSEKPKAILCWEKLYQIAIGIARGLEYLHRGCNTRIVHFDIKPHNILLDQEFCPKIADFGLAQLCLQQDSVLSLAGARGTIGYIAPEVFSRAFGVVSSKSDVYSYGMMVLEMVGVRKNFKKGVGNTSESYFPHWIHDRLDQNGGLQDFDVTDETEKMARKMILIGLWCIQTLPQNRPTISRVLDMLEGSVDDIQLPPKPYSYLLNHDQASINSSITSIT